MRPDAYAIIQVIAIGYVVIVSALLFAGVIP